MNRNEPITLEKRQTPQTFQSVYDEANNACVEGADISCYAPQFVFFMEKANYQNPQLWEQLHLQTKILNDMDTLLYLPFTDEKTQPRHQRVADWDMMICAADFLANKRLNCRSQTVTEYAVWGENIVTDTNNTLYKPHDEFTDSDTIAHYQGTNRKIHFGFYANKDCLADHDRARKYAAHEFAHMNSMLLQAKENNSSTDARLYNAHMYCKAMFERNHRKFKTIESELAALRVYEAQAEERMAQEAEQKMKRLAAKPQITRDELAKYAAELSEHPAFAACAEYIKIPGAADLGVQTKKLQNLVATVNLVNSLK